MNTLVQKYLSQKDAPEKQASVNELLVPSPCDRCIHRSRCADEHLACVAFTVFVNGQEDEFPNLFATDGSDREPNKEIYNQHFSQRA